jgi:K+-sensing histidine kinase KdpD
MTLKVDRPGAGLGLAMCHGFGDATHGTAVDRIDRGGAVLTMGLRMLAVVALEAAA